MEKYKKPKCDCGKPLYYVENVVVALTYSISKDGHNNKLISDDIINDTSTKFLECLLCGNKYEFDRDDEDRHIRGEETSFINS